MQKWLRKIFLFVAVMTVVAHNTLPHLHDDKKHAVANHHHDSNEHDKNVFSFAQLDDDFIPTNFLDVNIHLPVVYLLTPVIIYQVNLLQEKLNTGYNYYKEFPPPKVFFSDLPLRAPPSFVAA